MITIIRKCKYCGKEFDKTNMHNHVMYCSDYCRKQARREQKAMYQRKRRKLINQGVLIVKDTEKQVLGSGYLGNHRHNNFKREYNALENELKRLKIKKKTLINKIKTCNKS